MARPLLRAGSALLLALVLMWAIWSATGRVDAVGLDIPTTAIQTAELGPKGKQGNMLAIQPWLTPFDYASAQTLQHRLDGYLETARQKDWISPATIAVFPEYIGSWLAVAGEKEAVFRDNGVASAMTTVALTHLPAFGYYMLTAPAVQDTAKWALFSIKAQAMAHDYESVFRNLAKKFGVHIVAGSIVLPEPTLVDGTLRVRPGGAMRNISALFGPDGRIIPPLVVKSQPIDEELAFSIPGRVQDLPVFDTPAGKLGVLICADSWYPAAYENLQKNGAVLIAVPSFSSGDGVWQSTWSGYNGGPTQADVTASDVGRLTEGQAWLKYAMAGRAPAYGMQHGVNVFLRGTLWDLGSDGTTVALQNGKPVAGNISSQAVITNLWLP